MLLSSAVLVGLAALPFVACRGSPSCHFLPVPEENRVAFLFALDGWRPGEHDAMQDILKKKCRTKLPLTRMLHTSHTAILGGQGFVGETPYLGGFDNCLTEAMRRPLEAGGYRLADSVQCVESKMYKDPHRYGLLVTWLKGDFLRKESQAAYREESEAAYR